jgi:uncharacterized protein YtpQ (UPF0354 family)
MNPSTREYCLRSIACLKLEPPAERVQELLLVHGNDPVVHLLGHGLMIAYLVDEGDHFSYVQHEQLSEAGLAPAEFHAQAMQNLFTLAEQRVDVRPLGNIHTVIAGGNFEASLLLLDVFWTGWYGHLAPNGFVAAFPARDLLAFGDANSAEAIAELQALCDRTSGKVSHPLSSRLFRRIDGAWEPLAGQALH